MININLIIKSRADGYAGVAIGGRKNVKLQRVKFNTIHDIVLVRTTNFANNLLIVSAYFPPSTNRFLFDYEISRLLNFLEGKGKVLLLGYFNAKMRAWGCNNDAPKGKFLLHAARKCGLLCLNDGSPTFVVSRNVPGRASVLDLSFTNIVSNTSWKCNFGYAGGSYHRR